MDSICQSERNGYCCRANSNKILGSEPELTLLSQLFEVEPEIDVDPLTNRFVLTQIGKASRRSERRGGKHGSILCLEFRLSAQVTAFRLVEDWLLFGELMDGGVAGPAEHTEHMKLTTRRRLHAKFSGEDCVGRSLIVLPRSVI